jgi:hypothetical protein
MTKPPPSKKLTPRLIERHEALFPKLQTLTRKVQAISARRPRSLVPENMRMAAEALLFEALPFSAGRRRGELPVAAHDCAGLAGQLSAALAAMMAFEARHSQWDARFAEPVWMADDHQIRRLKRLAPKLGSKAAAKAAAKAEMEAAARAARMVELRAKLVQRLAQSRRHDPRFEKPSEPAGERVSTAPLDGTSVSENTPSLRFI